MDSAISKAIPAPIGRRILAFIIDTAIASALFYPLLLLLFLVLGVPNAEALAEEAHKLELRQLVMFLVGMLFAVLIFAAIWHVYFIYFEHIYRRTPGKKALSLMVVSENGKELSFKQCLVREIFRCYVDMLFIFPALISMYVTNKKQRIGDLATQTRVVYLPDLSASERFLYLSKDQYDLRKEHYRVLDAPLDEVNNFLSQSYAFLLGQSLPNVSEEFVGRYLQLGAQPLDDTYEMKHRFLAEYFLDLRRSA